MANLAVDPVAEIMPPLAWMVESSTGRLSLPIIPVMSTALTVCTVTLH
jgi:hypothetical protein